MQACASAHKLGSVVKIRVNSEKHLFIPAPSGLWGYVLMGTMAGLTPANDLCLHAHKHTGHFMSLAP